MHCSQSRWQEPQKMCRHIYPSKEEQKSSSSQKYFKEGEQMDHLLAMISRSQKSPTVINQAGGSIAFNTNGILQSFYDFYHQPYENKMSCSSTTISQFLANLELPTLKRVVWLKLEAPLNPKRNRNCCLLDIKPQVQMFFRSKYINNTARPYCQNSLQYL